MRWPISLTLLSCARFIKYEGFTVALAVEVVGVMMLLRIRAIYSGRTKTYITILLSTILIIETAINIWLISYSHRKSVFPLFRLSISRILLQRSSTIPNPVRLVSFFSLAYCLELARRNLDYSMQRCVRYREARSKNTGTGISVDSPRVRHHRICSYFVPDNTSPSQ